MAANQLEREIKTLKQDLIRLQSDFGRLAKNTGSAARAATDTAQEAGSGAVARVGEEASKVFDALKGAGQSAVGGGEHIVTGVHDRIQERPYVAIAAAAGLGFLAAMLLARRN